MNSLNRDREEAKSKDGLSVFETIFEMDNSLFFVMRSGTYNQEARSIRERAEKRINEIIQEAKASERKRCLEALEEERTTDPEYGELVVYWEDVVKAISAITNKR